MEWEGDGRGAWMSPSVSQGESEREKESDGTHATKDTQPPRLMFI